MTPAELGKMEKGATPKPWASWVVTTGLQEMPSGDKVPLIHGAAPPHEMRGDDYLKLPCKDAELIATLRNISPLLIELWRAAEEEPMREHWEESYCQEEYYDPYQDAAKRFDKALEALREFK